MIACTQRKWICLDRIAVKHPGMDCADPVDVGPADLQAEAGESVSLVPVTVCRGALPTLSLTDPLVTCVDWYIEAHTYLFFGTQCRPEHKFEVNVSRGSSRQGLKTGML